jgi:hypothetical protein
MSRRQCSVNARIAGSVMKIEKISAFAEIVSSIAIVATLVYLSVQMQQTNDALEANSRATTLMADMTMISTLVSNPEAVANFERPLDELTTAEREQLGNVIAGLLRSREFAWLQFQNGTLDKPTFESYLETLVRWINDYEASRFYWDLFSQTTNPEFTTYVNARLASPQ